MPSARDAALKAFDLVHRTHGETVRYRAGDIIVAELPAIPGKTEVPLFDAAGLETMAELQHFAVRADQLATDPTDAATRIRPERGHLIEVERDGQVHTFAVQHPDGNRPPFRGMDAYNAVLRIHAVAHEAPRAA